MICKSCGTECRGTYCSHCGALLVNEAFTASPNPTPLGESAENQAPFLAETGVASTSVTSKQEGEDVAQQQESSNVDNEGAGHKQKGARPAPQIKMRQIFFPSLMLLLPLLYLFVDVFVLYSEVLYMQSGTTNMLGALVARLTQAEFATNPVSDLIASTLGDSTVLLEALSVKDILAAADLYRPFAVPAVLLAVLACLSALCGLAVLFSKGRILYVRALTDVVITVGFAAAGAPFFSGAVFCLPYLFSGGLAGVDAAIRLFGFSIEVWLLCGLSFALMLPAVRSLRRTAARGGIYLTTSYRLLGKKIGISRFFGVFAALLASACSCAVLFLKISPNGALLPTFLNGMSGVGQSFLAFLGIFKGEELDAALGGLYSIILLPLVPTMVLCVLHSLVAAVRLLLAKPASVANKKRRRKRLLSTGAVLCRTSLSLLKSYMTFYVLSVLLLLFASAAWAHIDLALIPDTLTLLYLLIAQVKACGALNALGAVLVVLALFFGTSAGNFAKAFITASLEKHQETWG